ncbi:hypothetical protein BCON_0008g01040 [Botryotinia convoluta]|uniref:Uncharacterized protein n=1 Tax=Botryotinia convoluta TaxID=54673 RepID=A0A4Z1ISC7_9HELO|nr:hypothetical protein BCON_0008g01040 [Botryotinia convoluta]
MTGNSKNSCIWYGKIFRHLAYLAEMLLREEERSVFEISDRNAPELLEKIGEGEFQLQYPSISKTTKELQIQSLFHADDMDSGASGLPRAILNPGTCMKNSKFMCANRR